MDSWRQKGLQPAIAVMVCCLLVLLLPTAADAQSYSATDLGALNGSSSIALALNNAGQVVGYVSGTPSSPLQAAFIYKNGTTVGISPTSFSSIASAINDAGQVTGYFSPRDNTSRSYAFIYLNGAFTNLGPLNSNPGGQSVGLGINQEGTIVGQIESPSLKGMIYQDGAMSAFNNSNILTALAINSVGSIVGSLQNNRAFLFSAGKVVDLGTLDGGTDTTSVATAINDSGQVVGYSTLAANGITNGTTHAFIYQNGQMRDLGTLYGGYSYASGINKYGDVVGVSDGAGFLYHNGVMIDLRAASASTGFFGLEQAVAINDRGQIVGNGTFANVGTHAVLLTPR